MEPLAPSSAVESVIESSTVHDANSEQAAGFNFQPNYGIDGIGIIGSHFYVIRSCVINTYELFVYLALRDASENEETTNREGSAHNQDEDILEASRNEEGIQDDESDNEYTFNEPETESDSDDNQSNQDAQRSVQTGATLGSETGLEIIYYLFVK